MLQEQLSITMAKGEQEKDDLIDHIA
jgi:hypothetical protein